MGTKARGWRSATTQVDRKRFGVSRALRERERFMLRPWSTIFSSHWLEYMWALFRLFLVFVRMSSLEYSLLLCNILANRHSNWTGSTNTCRFICVQLFLLRATASYWYVWCCCCCGIQHCTYVVRWCCFSSFIIFLFKPNLQPPAAGVVLRRYISGLQRWRESIFSSSTGRILRAFVSGIRLGNSAGFSARYQAYPCFYGLLGVQRWRCTISWLGRVTRPN